MTQDLKNSLKIILNAYKEDKFTEEEVFTLLDSMINTNSGGSIITYPITCPITYPKSPWETYPTWELKPYCTTSTLDTERNGEQDTKTNIIG